MSPLRSGNRSDLPKPEMEVVGGRLAVLTLEDGFVTLDAPLSFKRCRVALNDLENAVGQL